MASISRLIYLYIKQRYSLWFLVLSIMVIFMELLGYILFSRIIIRMGIIRFGFSVPISLIVFLDFVVMASLILSTFYSPSYFTRSEVDFVFTSSWSPTRFLVIKVLGDAVYILILLTLLSMGQAFVYSLFKGPMVFIFYMINVLILSFIISELTFMLTIMGMRWRIISIIILIIYFSLSTAFMPAINILYAIVKPNVFYVVSLMMLLVVMLFALRRVSMLVYLDIYGRHVMSGGDFGGRSLNIKSSFNAVFISSVYSPLGVRRSLFSSIRVNSLIIAAVISIIIAFLYGYSLLRYDIDLSILDFLVYYMNFYLVLIVSLVLGGTLAFERVWVDFMFDAVKYIRLRMNVRLFNTYLVTLPWVLMNLLVYVLRHYVVVLLVVFPLISYPLMLVPLSWLLMALSGLPQMRELGLEYRPIRFNVSGAISGSLVTLVAGVLFIPSIINYVLVFPLYYTISASLIEILISALIYVILMYSRVGSGIWYWFMNKLSHIGYI